jgi:citrate lyase subunit beta/citryl-CoA lyase
MKALRSLLYVPASRPRMLARLRRLPADGFLVDLEDGVAPDEKAAARNHLREAVRRGLVRDELPWMLRINAPSSPWHYDDLDLAAELRPGVTVQPKAEEAAQVRRLCARCSAWGGEVGLMIETARGVSRVDELAGSHPSVVMLVLGSADYRRSIGARPESGRFWEALALQRLLLAARVHGCQAIDSVYFHYRDEPGLREHAAPARELGFDGKSCIHPDQIGPIHEMFTSNDEEVAWALAVRQAWVEQHGSERGVIVVDGEMIEALHVDVAERILSRRPGAGQAEGPPAQPGTLEETGRGGVT